MNIEMVKKEKYKFLFLIQSTFTPPLPIQRVPVMSKCDVGHASHVSIYVEGAEVYVHYFRLRVTDILMNLWV